MSAEPSQAPQDTDALLRSILESSLDGIMILRSVRDADGKIVDFEWILANDRAADQLGRTPGALIGSRLLAEMPGFIAEGRFDRYVRVAETGEPLDLEHHYERERSPAWFHTVAVRLNDGIMLTFADVTDRKQLEEQLMQSQKMEVIGRLAGGVAHDFKNLLTAISMNAEMALATLGSDAAGRAEIEGVLDGVKRASALTQHLLAFARRQSVSPRVVTVNDLVSHAEPMVRQLLGSHIELSVAACREPWAVSVDPVKFEQVLTNLAVNAHDAMQRGGRFTLDIKKVTVRAGDAGAIRHAPPGDYTRLDAEDTGTGMSPDVLQHIFEPFYTTKSAGRGTGLGLATCYGIIRQADGLMWATSTVGRGSTFTILLPRVHDTPSEWPPQSALEHARYGSERVLVVDDEPAVLGVVSRTLQRLGYRIASAGQGEEALAVLERDQDFDLVLSDIVMPRMDGRALRRAGRARFPTIPMLLMTGYDTESGGDDGPILKKPFTAAELATAVRDALDRPAVSNGVS